MFEFLSFNHLYIYLHVLYLLILYFSLLRKCLEKIAQIKAVRNEQRLLAKNSGLYGDGEGPRKTMRRGVLMTMLQQAALTLPLWIGRGEER